MYEWLNRQFELRARGSTVGRELRGAIATFLTMAYILFVNPGILGAAGVPFDAAITATALAAGICSILMGLFANFPIALASGMGLNAIVAFAITTKAGSWQAAMGLVVLDGIVTLVLVLVGLREAVMRAIPYALRQATGAGIGLFIAFIGLVNAKIVIAGPNGGPPVQPGTWHNHETAVAVAGLLVTAVLIAKRVKGALIIGILATTVIALLVGVTHLPNEFHWPVLGGVMFHADIRAALKLSLMPLLFALIMVDFIDTLGSATAIAEEGGLIDDRTGQIPRMRNILMIDSLSASIGGLLGASSVTCYVESAAGVAEGARTGLHSVFVGVLFLLSILAAPIVGIVPGAATAPALILVGFLMMAQIAKIDFNDLQNAIPAFITLIAIPLTYSIAHGIGYGFIAFVVNKLVSGNFREVHPVMYGATLAFVAYFVFGVA
ncbi:MAG TPA: NCS2 family permease [Tepidisphaeraceae bacterium]|nr:NCS2 family permease [Tepidisphaeraceae bacterium]